MDFALSCMVRNIGFSSMNQTIPVRIKRFQYESADSSYKKQKTHCFFQRNLRFLKNKNKNKNQHFFTDLPDPLVSVEENVVLRVA